MEVDRADPRADPRGRRHAARLRRAPCTAGRWASPSTATPSPRSRSSSTSPCCRATSASPAPDCARCAATPTCRATAPWASGRRCPTTSSTRLRDEYGFEPPREHGLDTVDSIRALRDGKARSSSRMGGNFVSAAPDTVVTEEAMEQAELTVNGLDQAEPLARPVRPRRADPARRSGAASGTAPAGSTSGSPSRTRCLPVHSSRGPLKPASQRPAVGGRHRLQHRRGDARHRRPGPVVGVPLRLRRHPQGDLARRARLRVVRREGEPARWLRAAAPAARQPRTFPTETGQGDLHASSPMDVLTVPEGRLLLQGLRSHDQFNTTIYGLSDRYRGISGGRRVVFLHPDDIAALRLRRRRRRRPGQRVGGRHRALGAVVPDRRVRHPARLRGGVLPRGQPAGPARLHRRRAATARPRSRSSSGSSASRVTTPTSTAKGAPVGSDRGHKSDVEPEHLS